MSGENNEVCLVFVCLWYCLNAGEVQLLIKVPGGLHVRLSF